MEFDASATVETVIELDENGQPIIEVASEEIEAVADEAMEEAAVEVTPESEEKSDEHK
jgi:segregation and condensation protein B